MMSSRGRDRRFGEKCMARSVKDRASVVHGEDSRNRVDFVRYGF